MLPGPTSIGPHSSLGQQTPSEFVAGWQQTRTDQKAGFLTAKWSNNRGGVTPRFSLFYFGRVLREEVSPIFSILGR